MAIGQELSSIDFQSIIGGPLNWTSGSRRVGGTRRAWGVLARTEQDEDGAPARCLEWDFGRDSRKRFGGRRFEPGAIVETAEVKELASGTSVVRLKITLREGLEWAVRASDSGGVLRTLQVE